MATHARKTFGLFTQVSGSGPLGPLVRHHIFGIVSLLWVRKKWYHVSPIKLQMIYLGAKQGWPGNTGGGNSQR